MLCRPDQLIIEALDQGEDMYLIAKGECKATINDNFEANLDSESEEEPDFVDLSKVKLLRPGHYFGEISLIFGCERSAQVIATKYCTLAKLNRTQYKEILIIMPTIEEVLKSNIMKYNDRQIKFIKGSIQMVPFLSNLGDNIIQSVIFSLTTKKYNKNEIFQKPGDAAQEIYFL